jgi:hypothetical protein
MEEVESHDGRNSQLSSLQNKQLNGYLKVIALCKSVVKYPLCKPVVEVDDSFFSVSDFAVAGGEVLSTCEAYVLLVTNPSVNPLDALI